MEVDSSTESWIVLLILLILQALLTAARTSVLNARRTRLRQRQDEKDSSMLLIARMVEDSTRFRVTTQIAATLIHLLIATLAVTRLARPLAEMLNVPWLAPANQWLATLIAILLLGLVILILGDVFPSLLALRYSESFSSVLARPLVALQTILWPFTKLVIGISRALAKLFGNEPEGGMPLITEEEIKSLVDAGEEEGVIEEDEKEMIFSIFELGDTLAREVMVPRIDVVAVEVNTPLLQALDVIMDAGHSRIPVYRETIDNIVGVLYVKDMLPYLKSGQTDIPLEMILREPYFIPETKNVDQLLPDFQQRKVHMAIVVDEYGGTAGLVTIEDLLEEIVGEIQDEYDREEPIYEVISDDEYILNARIDLDDLAKLLGIEFPDEGSDTLGGFIYDQLGRVPVEGDVVQYDGLKITVISVEGRRINKVRVILDRGAVDSERIVIPQKEPRETEKIEQPHEPAAE